MAEERERMIPDDHEHEHERGTSFDQRSTPSRKHPSDEGSSPYRPTGDPDAEDVPIEEEPHSAVTPDPYSGVSWEEMRKGMAPQETTGKDDALYHDRMASQRHAVDNPESSWDTTNKDTDASKPTSRIPDNPPDPY